MLAAGRRFYCIICVTNLRIMAFVFGLAAGQLIMGVCYRLPPHFHKFPFKLCVSEASPEIFENPGKLHSEKVFD